MADNEKMFQVQVITPDRVFYAGEAEMIEFTTNSGQIGVYKNHIPLTTVLAPGAVIIHEAEGEKIAAVHAGFAEILPEQVTLLAEIAEWSEEIDINRAEAAKKRAEERLMAKTADIDLARAEFALRKALTRIGVKDMK
ncbi:MAG: ATP synthase F1 subunit epsilon [Eubacterium sp.]|jgi:F-type H+-transporting ATPase subunit epsilon|nr:ATP synthase F1 subunit epsilon [Eubacterium sp.]